MQKSQTQDNALTAGAELVEAGAQDIGMKIGLAKEIASVTVLERALAIAWTDVFMFQGANPSPERLQEAINTMSERIGNEMKAQAILRRGHNADYGKRRDH